MKYGLALEGGGARGAYHIGVIRALQENGYEFGAVAGTSVGAINGALLAQGDFSVMEEIWKHWSFSDIFDIEDEHISRAMRKDLDMDVIRYLSKQLGKALKEKGIDTLKLRKVLEDIVQENKLRNSPIDFGLVTVCISDKQAQELFLEDIPEGKVVDYIMASSSLPVFKTMKIGDKQYLDGGMYDNCPVHMLEKKGYQDVIAVRTFKRMRIRDYKNIVKRNHVTIHMISPTDTLPNILNFDTQALNQMLTIGYYDGLRFVHHLEGYRYYIQKTSEKEIQELLEKIPADKIVDMAQLLRIDLIRNAHIRDTLYFRILPILASKTQIKQTTTTKKDVIAILEEVALRNKVERFCVYPSFQKWIAAIQKAVVNKVGRNRYEKAMYLLVKSM